MDSATVEKGIDEYVKHIGHVAEIFNKWSTHHQLGVTMDPSNAIQSVKNGTTLARVAPFWSRVDDTGVVHDTQIKTAVDCIAALKKDPKRCGHVVGAMQSGKTTAALALQWAGPILYLLTGKKVYPFHIISNQTTHENQTQIELDAFLDYYADIEFVLDKSIPSTPGIDPIFERSRSLATYRGHVLRNSGSVFEVPELEDLHRRVGGAKSIEKIVELCRHATDQQTTPLMIIDEPQFGASDHFVETEDGQEQRKCVLAKILDAIEKELGSTRADHWFIGLSATPFELNDLKRIWEVRQDLTEEYSGFNYFNGEPIAPDVDIKPPKTMGLRNFAKSVDVSFLEDFKMSAYDFGKPKAFDAYVRKMDYKGSQSDYRRQTEKAFRDAIYAVLEQYKKDPKWPVGLCIRALNNNDKTDAFIAGLNLDPNRVEIIRYYDTETTGISVKRAVAHRTRPELPYIIFVTSRARMADAFPTSTRFFMDLAEKASDLNALLQGLLGRACGYGKSSTVVLSDTNAGIVYDYVATKGKYVHRTSRHSVAVGGMRRGAPSTMLKIRDEMQDAVVQEFMTRINKEVVQKILQPSASPRLPRGKEGQPRRGPILKIAESLGLFEHIEKPEVRMQIYPYIHTGFRVARSTDAVRHTSRAGVMLRYSLDSEGNCRYTFRNIDRSDPAQGGATGRAKGKRDSEQHMEPTIYLEKYDPETGDTINDESAVGAWRAFMVTFPLVEPVREVRSAEVAYPVEHSPFNDYMEDDEKSTRDTGASH